MVRLSRNEILLFHLEVNTFTLDFETRFSYKPCLV